MKEYAELVNLAITKSLQSEDIQYSDPGCFVWELPEFPVNTFEPVNVVEYDRTVDYVISQNCISGHVMLGIVHVRDLADLLYAGARVIWDKAEKDGLEVRTVMFSASSITSTPEDMDWCCAIIGRAVTLPPVSESSYKNGKLINYKPMPKINC